MLLIELYVKLNLLEKAGFYYSPIFYDLSNSEGDLFCYLGHSNGKSIMVIREDKDIKKEGKKIKIDQREMPRLRSEYRGK